MKKHIALIVLAALTLSGCSKEKLFGSTDGPDEFMVLKQKPLTMPTNTAQLPAPSNVPQSVINQDATRKNLKDLLGTQSTQRTISTAGDKKLLEMAGATNASDDILEKLASDEKAKEDDRRLLDKWLNRDIKSDPYVDVAKEKERLKTVKNPSEIDANIPAKTQSGDEIVIAH